VGAQASGFLPVGAWSRHVLAGQTLGEASIPADLTQFGPGFGGLLEAGYKFRNRFGLGLRIELSSLSTADWDRYARQMGADIHSRAMRWSVEALWEIDLVRLDPVRLEARLGLGYSQAWGQEDNATYQLTYDYEFLEPSISVRAGLGLGWELTSGLEILALVDFQAGHPGLDYSSESGQRPLLGFGLGLGLRFYPARLAQRGER
jgi:hypothetical protein